jgi:hypothetical protein
MSEKQEVEQEIPEWQSKLKDLNLRSNYTDPISTDISDHYIKQDEIAMKHPSLDSIIKINDDGCIDIFADDTLGIRLDPTTKSINIFGDNINLFTKRLNMTTKLDGFIWNGHHFNPQVYYESDTENDQYVTGTKNYWVYSTELGWHWERGNWSYKPMINATGRTQYSDGMIKILNNLGLPTE